jgi:cellulose synthase operon protein C
MDPRETDALVQRLVHNPHDQEAILYAHGAGQSDPKWYATLLEKVGAATTEPSLASHWLTEAANVWVTSLGDAHRAARALMIAIDRDPTQSAPAERLADLYREKGDAKALAALLERRAKALGPLAQQDPEMRVYVASLHQELGRIWQDAPLANPTKAAENYRRAIEHDPQDAYSIYAVREILKTTGQFAEAVPYFAMEQALVADPERKLALYQDEAEVRRTVGDLNGAIDTLREARRVDAEDPVLMQQLGTLVLERVRGNERVDENAKAEAADLFAHLAELYPGEHGLAYATCALEVLPGHDRAIQLAIYYGDQLGKQAEIGPFAASYVESNPTGVMAEEARRAAGDAKPRAPAPAEPAQAKAAERSEAAPAPRRQAAVAPMSEPDSSAEVEPEPAPRLDASDVGGLIDKAQKLAAKNRRNEAAGVYTDVLNADPANPDALAFLQTHLRQTRKYAQLRDVLFKAASAPGSSQDSRVGYLREAAGLCESQLRDWDSAIQAWQQIAAVEPGESEPREQLRRLLERSQKWDDLATLLEQEAEVEGDLENRIALEKQLAKLHETRRKNPADAGEAWARIAALTPNDEAAITTAIRFFDKAERPDLAAKVIAENVGSVEDEQTKGQLYKRLAELRAASGETAAAGEAYAEAALALKDATLWEAAEQCYVEAEAWEQAATAVNERAELASKPKERGALFAKEADYLERAGDHEAAVVRLENATDADPANDEFAQKLEAVLVSAERSEDLAAFLLRRAEKLQDGTARVALRKRAALLQRETLGDADGARASLELVLADADDGETLLLLAEDAEGRAEPQQAVEYLARLIKSTADREQQLAVTLRRAQLLAEGLDDVEAALEQYETILLELDPKNEAALVSITGLEERRDNPEGIANALERHLRVVAEPAVKASLAGRLADLYETRLDDLHAALRSLLVVHAADPDDFDAIGRITVVAERLEEWPTVVEHLAMLVEVEGDEEELSRMTRRRAEILADKLQRADEALAVLAAVGDQGDPACREEFIALGDTLDKKGAVAAKMVEWYRDHRRAEERSDKLHGALERFLEVGNDAEAIEVAKDLARMRSLRTEVATPLESAAVRARDLDGLGIAHDLLVRDASGPVRAEEMVRQAEVLARAGVDALEAIQHGEQALTSVSPEDVEPLLERLAALAEGPGHVIDLYERQVSRCKAPQDRLAALARASQVAAEKGAMDRARGFFDLALGGGAQDETVESLQAIAREADDRAGGETLRRTLAEALAAGGQGARDGGRTRSSLLRRAAVMMAEDLGDFEKAFAWIGEALVTHVDDEGLDALIAMAQRVGDPRRADVVLTKALEEVFDGPLVRKLLARRASVREGLGDPRAAAEDLKRLHDLAPADTEVTDRLSALYTDLGDYRGIVQLHEDQILRSRDQAVRAELARKVAQLWESELSDPREAADAWRRVLRMKAGDAEAQEGLERAKANMNRPKAEQIPPPEPTEAPEVPAPDEPPDEGPEASAAPDQEGASVESASLATDSSEGISEAPDTQADDTVADPSVFSVGSDEEPVATAAEPIAMPSFGFAIGDEAQTQANGYGLEGATLPSGEASVLADATDDLELDRTIADAVPRALIEPSSPGGTAGEVPIAPPAESTSERTQPSSPPPPMPRPSSRPPPAPRLSSRPPPASRPLPPPPSSVSRPPPPPSSSGASRPPPPPGRLGPPSRPPSAPPSRLPPPPPSVGARRPLPPPPRMATIPQDAGSLGADALDMDDIDISVDDSELLDE